MDRLDLERLLLAHTPADRREAGFRARMLDLLGASEPWSRSHFVPGHFTASAFVRAPDAGDLLLVFHGKLERWLQPGGHVDPADASIIAAARREVAEETGLVELELLGRGIFDVDIHTIPARQAEPAHEHFDVRFLFRAVSRACAAGDDARDARWVTLEEIDGIRTDESVRRAVRKLRT